MLFVFSNFLNITLSIIQSIRLLNKKEDDGEKKIRETIRTTLSHSTFIIETTRSVLVGTPCVYGALIGWLVARMPGYLCPEASPPWRKRCFRKRGPPLSAEQSSTDPRPRKVVVDPLARARYQSNTLCVCPCPPFPLQRVSIVTICHPLRPSRSVDLAEFHPRISYSFPFFFFPPPNRRSKTKKPQPSLLFRASSMFFRFNDSSVIHLPWDGMLRRLLGSALIPSFRGLFSFRAT